MRDKLARYALLAFGLFAIGAGSMALFGLSRFESRLTAVLVGLGALGGGISMVRRSRGSNPRIGSPTP